MLARLDHRLALLAAERPLWPMLFVACFALILFLPGFFSMPPLDRDETRFSQASRQMVASGDYVDIQLGEGKRYKKPIGIYWLQFIPAKIAGPELAREVWVYRLPSLVMAVAACLLTYLIALSLVNAQAALMAALLMATCFVLNGEARLAKTDATLLASILAAQWALARLHMRGALRRWDVVVFWGALGVSALVKGPIGPMVVGLTVLALCLLRRDLRWLAPLRPARGFALFLLIVVPWYVAITLKSGNAFWDEALGRDLLGKIGQGQENHGAPTGAFTIAMWLTFWPASIFLPFGLWFAWTARREAAVLFCLAWWLPSWLVFELTATKLIHYVLPTYPALAILCAAGWLDREHGTPGRGFSIFLIVLLALAALLAVVPVGFTMQFGSGPAWPWYLGAVVSGFGVWFTWTRLRAGDRVAPLLGLGALSVGLSLSLFANLARFDPLWPSVALADMAEQAGCERVISLGYQEESLMLLTRDLPVFLHDPAAVPAHLAAEGCTLALVDAPHQPGFEAALQGRPAEPIGRFQGFSIGGADEVDITGYVIR